MEKRTIAIAAAALLILAVGAALVLGAQPKPTPAAPNYTQNTTQPVPEQNLTGPQNATAPPPPPPAPSAPQKSSESIGALLSDGLARADARFEAEKGPYVYDISPYSWRYSTSDSDPPDLVPVRKNDLNASAIRFPDHYVDSLRGFAFKTYQPQQLAGPMKLFGVAVFLADSTPLDAYVGGGSFNMTYDPHPMLSQTLEGCSILNSTALSTESGSNIKVYDFRCKIIYGASP